jgi:branched-chain amino acid transport system substrate-binding protein
VGRAFFEGVQAVFSEVNEAGGIDGVKIEYLVEDDQFDPVRGKALVRKLIHDDKVFAFSGIFSPFTTQAALPDIRAAGVPVVPPSGSDDREFDEPLLFPVTNPCGRQMAGNIEHAVRRQGLRRFAVVYLNVEAVTNCVDQFSAVARKLGGEVVFKGGTTPAAPDCGSRILAARASGAEVLVLIVDNLGVVKCVQARDQQGWDAPTTISYNIVDDPTLFDGLGKRAEGLMSSSPFSGATSAEYQRHCQAVPRFYPKAKVQFFLVVGCVGARILVDALRVAGPDATRQALIAHLESGMTFGSGGLAPEIRWRPGGRLPYDLTAPVRVEGGRWVRIGSLYTPVQP